MVRMFCYLTIVHAGGEKKVLGWRTETNPPMPREYLDPYYPEDKKKGLDWSMLIHGTYPADIRGDSILMKKGTSRITRLGFPFQEV